MTPLDPLYSVSCSACGRAYLAYVEDFVRTEGGCPACGSPAVSTSRVPDEEDVPCPRRLLSMDPAEHSERLRLYSARLRRDSDAERRDSDALLLEAKAALDAAAVLLAAA